MSIDGSLWRLLLKDPSKLTCDECFAVLEYYSELLAQGGTDLFPKVMEHLQGCPACRSEHQEALRCLEATHQEEQNGASR
jgi:predicted anti-sigma-YlaC factor YlaD